jgi:acyl-CoA reductase-like NAD-dependent aldehyde dehydrogenase
VTDVSDGLDTFAMLIDGRLLQSVGAPLAVVNPANEQVVAQVPDATFEAYASDQPKIERDLNDEH